METSSKIDKTIRVAPVRPASGLKRFGEFLLDSPAMVLRFIVYIAGIVPNVAAYVFNALYDFCVTYKREISIALWVGLGIAVAAAIAGLVMALWFPAALAAVTGVSVFGFSIAMIAGESALLQVLLGAGLALVVADLAAVALATVFIGIKEGFAWIKSGFSHEENEIADAQSSPIRKRGTNPFELETMQSQKTIPQSEMKEPMHQKHPLKNNGVIDEDYELANNFDNNFNGFS